MQIIFYRMWRAFSLRTLQGEWRSWFNSESRRRILIQPWPIQWGMATRRSMENHYQVSLVATEFWFWQKRKKILKTAKHACIGKTNYLLPATWHKIGQNWFVFRWCGDKAGAWGETVWSAWWHQENDENSLQEASWGPCRPWTGLPGWKTSRTQVHHWCPVAISQVSTNES